MSDKLDAIDHIAISVDDLKGTVDWYLTTFKCEVEYQDDTWALLRFANETLLVVAATFRLWQC